MLCHCEQEDVMSALVALGVVVHSLDLIKFCSHGWRSRIICTLRQCST